jgi:hypothetical protein
MDNLSNLGADLRELEVKHVMNDDGAAIDARQELVKAAGQYHRSRYRFGETLSIYRAYFLEQGGWVEAAKVIGKAIDRDEKTIFRIIKDYARASKLPATALRQLEAEGIDPAAKKNESVVANILAMPASAVEADPKTAVITAVQAAKAEKKAAPTKSAGADSATTTPSVPVIDAAAMLKPKAETLCASIRRAIEMGLAGKPADRKFDELKRAFEEEMYEWGMRDVRMIVLTPRPPVQPAGPEAISSICLSQSEAA